LTSPLRRRLHDSRAANPKTPTAKLGWIDAVAPLLSTAGANPARRRPLDQNKLPSPGPDDALFTVGAGGAGGGTRVDASTCGAFGAPLVVPAPAGRVVAAVSLGAGGANDDDDPPRGMIGFNSCSGGVVETVATADPLPAFEVCGLEGDGDRVLAALVVDPCGLATGGLGR